MLTFHYFSAQNIVVQIITLVIWLLNPYSIPSCEIWLILSNDIATSFTGIQLIACDTETCDHPQLLQQFGRCDAQNCIPLTQKTGYEWFNCYDNLCRSIRPDNIIVNYSKLLISMPNQTLEGQIMRGYDKSQAWRVTLKQNKLVIQNDPIYEPMGMPRLFRLFPQVVMLTLGVEFVLTLPYFQLWLKLPRIQTLRFIIITTLNHLITLPTVWFFFPTLGYFMSGEARIGGRIALIYSLMMFAFLLFTSNTSLKFQLVSTVGLTIIAVPSCWFIFFLTTWMNDEVYMTGVSKSSIFLATELFAVLMETTLLIVLSKGVVSKQQAISLCFITNIISVIIIMSIIRQ